MTEREQPIEEQFRMMMNETMTGLDFLFNEGKKHPNKDVGIILFIFNYGDAGSGRFNYISNGANRSDIAKMMREQADKFEAEDALHK